MCAVELRVGDVFRSRAGGDFAGLTFYVHKIKQIATVGGWRYCCKDFGGYSDWYSLEEIDPDPATVRPYDADRDPDFIGLCSG